MFKRLGAFFLDILEVIVGAVAIFLVLYLLVMQPHKVDGNSMQPNYPDAEYLLTDKISYRFNNPQRGDVVVLKSPIEDKEYIKRVIGLPGETISLKEGRVYINDQKLEEKYLASDLLTGGNQALPENGSYKVPEGEYFVMGDNRPNSLDSRVFGSIAKNKILGRAWLVYWPVNKAGVVKKPQY